MNQRKWLIPVLLLQLLTACSQELSVEQQVIAVIREMETRVEDGERRPFMSHVAQDFSGQQEGMTRDQLRALFIYQLNRHQRLQAQLFPINVTETGIGTATASFRALVTGGPGWLPDSGQLYDFKTGWRRDDDAWMLVSASWQPVPLDELLD